MENYLEMAKRQEEALKSYTRSLLPRFVYLIGSSSTLYLNIVSYAMSGHNYMNSLARQRDLVAQLQKLAARGFDQVFSGGRYRVLTTLLGEEWAARFKKVWARIPDYPYGTGVLRRSPRAAGGDALYIYQGVDKLKSILELVSLGFTFEEFFKSSKEPLYAQNNALPDLIALEIDEGNPQIINACRETILGENNVIVSRAILKGMLMSHNQEMHALLGDLLLAARLQEGLRQSIVEVMDEGAPEAFIYLLGLIIEHDLARFSSVIRGLDVWTGLAISVEKPAVVKKCLEIAFRCLNDRDYARFSLESMDNLQIYMGLWALAFRDINLTEGHFQALLASQEPHRRLTALYFLNQCQYPMFQHTLALPLLDDPVSEVKAWALANLCQDPNFRASLFSEAQHLYPSDNHFASRDLFERLKHFVDTLPKKETVFKKSVFPWGQASLSRSLVLDKMLPALGRKPDSKLVDEMLAYMDSMSADTRHAFVRGYLAKPRTSRQKSTLVQLLGDRSQYVRQEAATILQKVSLTGEDFLVVEDCLKYKAGDLRKNCIAILLRQPQQDLYKSILRLAESGDEGKSLAALDIIREIDNKTSYSKIQEPCRELARSLEGVSQQAKILAAAVAEPSPEYTLAAGLGLFDPQKSLNLPETRPSPGFTAKGFLATPLSELVRILLHFDGLVEAHQDHEYQSALGHKTTLGGESLFLPGAHPYQKVTLQDLPLTEVWRQAAGGLKLSPKQLLELCYYTARSGTYSPYGGRHRWVTPLMQNCLPGYYQAFDKDYKKLKYPHHVHVILKAMLGEESEEELFPFCRDAALAFLQNIPRKRFTEECEQAPDYISQGRRNRPWCLLADTVEISFWTGHLRHFACSDESFKEFFAIGYAFAEASGFNTDSSLEPQDYERAYNLGLIDDNELFRYLCGSPLSEQHIKYLTSEYWRNRHGGELDRLREVCAQVAEQVLEIELRRGDLPTEASPLAAAIGRCQGVKTFIRLLIGTEKDSFVRGYNFVSGDSTRTQIFSHLLKVCYPAPGEDEGSLQEALLPYKVKEKQLLEAAMYAPQWLDIVEKYLEWPGLKTAGWYFHAHVNEHFDRDKEATVARFSPIEPHEFKAGAFDLHWFSEAYAALGEKRFQAIYDSARYIAGGALHRRSQLYADAALGRLKQGDVEERINSKRNKDYVMAYGLLPLQGQDDILRRYEFLHAFRKESQRFGAQRRESEGKAVAVALDNLARNAGYPDVTRFAWAMETEKLALVREYLQPAPVEDATLWIEIDAAGWAAIKGSREGKELKEIPSRLKSKDYVVQLKATQKALRDQHSRARWILEKSMLQGDCFRASELINLSRNPVLAPLMGNLVLKSGQDLGYFREGSLGGPLGKARPLNPEAGCFIAHPLHLLESGEWAAFQQDLFRRNIRQPFKQVFRELYIPNADEVGQTLSYRYAGHQVQPRKAAALLRGRGWTVGYEEGLQKVWYRENIVALIYAQADWFSPAEVEAPALEAVGFVNRKTGEPLKMEEIPQVIFSEAMRDLDLVVSIAHVGGVDPEASLSTVEMRTALIGEMLRLLKSTNVEVLGSHAYIQGVHGRYTVHLGSGVVHKMAGGAVHIIAVHGQHRGRIFLPFLDEDPRTAEIITKITFLSADEKIKDPSILIQIAGGANLPSDLLL